MKLYYDIKSDKIIEAGIIKGLSLSRDALGNITTDEQINQLFLIGDIYNEPIELPRNLNLELKKIEGDRSYNIQNGYAKEEKIQEGLRFVIQGRGFSYYSTNIVVATERISDTRIEFYTLSGSHYSLEVQEVI